MSSQEFRWSDAVVVPNMHVRSGWRTVVQASKRGEGVGACFSIPLPLASISCKKQLVLVARLTQLHRSIGFKYEEKGKLCVSRGCRARFIFKKLSFFKSIYKLKIMVQKQQNYELIFKSSRGPFLREWWLILRPVKSWDRWSYNVVQ